MVKWSKATSKAGNNVSFSMADYVVVRGWNYLDMPSLTFDAYETNKKVNCF